MKIAQWGTDSRSVAGVVCVSASQSAILCTLSGSPTGGRRLKTFPSRNIGSRFASLLAGNPLDVLATNFSKPVTLFERVPQRDVFIASKVGPDKIGA